jgi:enoyl-CoA hydratase
MTEPLVVFESSRPVATITINRPDKLNALNAGVLEVLGTAVKTLAADREVRAVVITGAGRAFVAGADIAEIAGESRTTLERFALRGQELFNAIEQMRKPVIAAVNGFAFGGGCELALACHIRVASTAAKFGLPEVKLGLIPGYGGTQRLPRLVGRGAALKMILTGDAIDAAEAYRIGLADALAEPEQLMEAAYAIANTAAKNGPVAIERALDAVDTGQDLSLGDALRAEAGLFGTLGETSDMREGTRAFMEKRAAKFTGA